MIFSEFKAALEVRFYCDITYLDKFGVMLNNQPNLRTTIACNPNEIVDYKQVVLYLAQMFSKNYYINGNPRYCYKRCI